MSMGKYLLAGLAACFGLFAEWDLSVHIYRRGIRQYWNLGWLKHNTVSCEREISTVDNLRLEPMPNVPIGGGVLGMDRVTQRWN